MGVATGSPTVWCRTVAMSAKIATGAEMSLDFSCLEDNIPSMATKLPYITRLERDFRNADQEVVALRDGMVGLIGYLSGSKFQIDPTVQVADVITHLREIMFAGTDARYPSVVEIEGKEPV